MDINITNYKTIKIEFAHYLLLLTLYSDQHYLLTSADFRRTWVKLVFWVCTCQN